MVGGCVFFYNLKMIVPLMKLGFFFRIVSITDSTTELMDSLVAKHSVLM